MAILIKGGLIVPFDGTEPRVADVLVDGERIARVGDGLEAQGADVIDAAGKVVLPGLVQGHVHLCQTIFRATAEDMPLLEWLERRTVPLELAHSYDTLYASAALGALELLLSGVTTALDFGTFDHQRAVFDACAEVGLRVFSGLAIADNVDLWPPAAALPSAEKQIKLAEKMLSEYEGAPAAEYVLCPRFLLGVTDRMWGKIVALANEAGAKIHTHASENEEETRLFRERYGWGNIEALFRLGALSERAFVAHCIHLDDAELGMLRESGAHVLHCPGANLKLASGIADVVRMVEMGIGVLVGSDGAGCNNRYDIWRDLRLAALLQKVKYGASALSASTVLSFATADAAEALGLAAGKIKPGFLADLVVLDLRKPQSVAPMSDDVYSQILYGAGPENVECVVVGGRVVVRDGAPVGVSVDEVIASAERAAREILARAKLR